MKPPVAFPRIIGPAVRAGATAMLISACGGAKQAHVVTTIGPPLEALGRTNAQPAASPPEASGASTVTISEEVLRACNIPDADAYFAFDSSRLTTFDQSPLDKVATCFVSGPMAGRKLRLVGHADRRGAADYNMTLGQSRADAVALYLDTHGMSRSNSTSTSRGAMDATGHDETGWAHDRRVDVTLAQ